MLIPKPDLVFILLRMLMSLFLMVLGGVLSDNFIGILVK